MADGTLKPIGEITVGDMVASRNEFTFVYSKRPVTAVMVHDDPVKVHLTVETSEQKLETIETTPNHPFHVQGHGFLRADKLDKDMLISSHAPKLKPQLLLTSNKADTSGYLRIKAITLEKKTFSAWDLTVGTDHTFFVGQSKAWVHNCFKDIAQFRKDLGLPPAGSKRDKSTVAAMEVNGQKIYGINAHGQDIKGVNAISKTHAELDVLNQIKQKGIDVSGQKLTLYVDRQPCKACDQNGGIRSMVRQLGIKELTVKGPNGTITVTPD